MTALPKTPGPLHLFFGQKLSAMAAEAEVAPGGGPVLETLLGGNTRTLTKGLLRFPNVDRDWSVAGHLRDIG